MFAPNTRKVLGKDFLRVANVTSGLALLMTAVSVQAESEPVCRWLNLDETRVYQCAVLPEVAQQGGSDLSEGLPDPTTPLSQQAMPRKVGPDSAILANRMEKPALEPETRSAAAAAPTRAQRYMVLGIGEIAALKSSLQAGDDSHFSYIRSRNRLSLGVFSSEANARGRQLALAQMGIETEIESLGGQRAGSTGNGAAVSSLAQQRSPTEKEGAKHDSQERQGDESEVVNANSDASSAVKWSVPGYTQLPIANTFSQGVMLKTGGEQPLVTTDVEVEKTAKTKTRSAEVMGFIVASVGDADSVVQKLNALGSDDFVLLRTGPYANRVSVGVYSSLDNAFARQAYFAEHGISSEVVSRSTEQVMEKVAAKAVEKSPEKAPEKAPEQREYPQIALIPLDI